MVAIWSLATLYDVLTLCCKSLISFSVLCVFVHSFGINLTEYVCFLSSYLQFLIADYL